MALPNPVDDSTHKNSSRVSEPVYDQDEVIFDLIRKITVEGSDDETDTEMPSDEDKEYYAVEILSSTTGCSTEQNL